MELKKGQKIDITKTNPNIKSIVVSMGWNTKDYRENNEFDIDAAAFVLCENSKVESDDDFVFYNNSNWGKGAISHSVNENTNIEDKESIKIEFSKLPNKVSKIAFTCTIYDFDKRNQNFGQVKNAYIKVINEENGIEIARYNLEGNMSIETAIVFGELYKHNNEWKFNPIGSGYIGGLNALCKDYGVTVDEEIIKNSNQNNPIPPIAQEKIKINLSKIILEKKGDKINLSKSSDDKIGKIIINLQWSRGKKKLSLLGSLMNDNNGIDLDLGCLFELKNGSKSVVQALGNRFGNYEYEPYIKLLDDDRTGDSKAGEFMWINGDKIKEIKRILVFAFIYEGITNWSQADGVITVKQISGPDIIINMDEPRDGLGMCGAILLENINNELRLQKIEQYYPSHRELDEAFGWGMKWVVGSK